MKPNQTYKLLYSKGNHDWEKIFANGVTDFPKYTIIQFDNMGRRPRVKFLQRRNADSQ